MLHTDVSGLLPQSRLQQPPAAQDAGGRAPIFDENAESKQKVNRDNTSSKAGPGAAKPKGLRQKAESTATEEPASHQRSAGSPQFFSAVAAGASPTLTTKKAQDQALDLLPSPTATVLPGCAGAGKESVPHQAFEFKTVVSPTFNTKHAEASALDLMPSPTATVPVTAERLEFRPSKPADMPVATGGGFIVREDTAMGGFVSWDASEPQDVGGGGFVIREDTDMLGQDGGGGQPAGAVQPCASAGFVVREDTWTNLKGTVFAEPPPSCAEVASSNGARLSSIISLLLGDLWPACTGKCCAKLRRTFCIALHAPTCGLSC